jgi:DNA-binding CsgD family transcriptional regulator
VATVINDPLLSSSGNSVNLSRLNEAERRVLALLAEGHTAKSIATTIGSTPAAVNERLREARRKTGVGSSRELARLLKAQENRDEQIGVGKDSLAGASLAEQDALSRRPRTGVFAVIGLFFVAAAGAAALMSQEVSPTAANVTDPLIGTPLSNPPNLVALHEKVRSEARDQDWADRMESAIRARIFQIPLVGKNGNVVRITCGSSLCEVAGTLVSPEDKAEFDDQRSQFNRTVKALQVPPLTDDLAKLGLKMDAATFTSGRGKPDKLAFLLYYSRIK